MRKLIAVLCMLMMVCVLLCGCVEEMEEDGKILNRDSLTVLGSGEKMFYFSVFDTDGNERKAEIHTDCETVGEALLEHELIAGEISEYGIYVKTVDGTTLDYTEDGKYWAFYIGQEYAMTGVDFTEIEAGASYSFRAES